MFVVRAVSRAVIGAFLFWGATNAPAFAAPAAVDTSLINKSVVWVDVEWKGLVKVPLTTGTRQYAGTGVVKCTGFFVSPDADVATAGHCVQPDRDTEVRVIRDVIRQNNLNVTADPRTLNWEVTLQQRTAFVGQPDVPGGGTLAGKNPVIAQVVASQAFANGDNALLKVANMTVDSYLPVSAAKPKPQDKVTAVGFPGSVERVTDATRQPATINSGSVSSLSTTTGGVPVIQVNAAVSGGMSGGPTLNEAGEVIGINSFGPSAQENQDINFVTDTDVMRRFMASNGVKLDSAPTQSRVTATAPTQAAGPAVEQASSTSSSTPWWLIAGVVAVLLLLIAVIGFLVLQLRKSRAAAAGPTAGSWGPHQNPPPQR